MANKYDDETVSGITNCLQLQKLPFILPISRIFSPLSGKPHPFDIIFTLLKHSSNKTN